MQEGRKRAQRTKLRGTNVREGLSRRGAFFLLPSYFFLSIPPFVKNFTKSLRGRQSLLF
jgi:hypothetical protein